MKIEIKALMTGAFPIDADDGYLLSVAPEGTNFTAVALLEDEEGNRWEEEVFFATLQDYREEQERIWNG